MEACASGASFSAGANWLANLIVAQTFPSLSSTLGAYCFVPYAVVLIAFVFFLMLRVPETKGKSLKQILSELEGVPCDAANEENLTRPLTKHVPKPAKVPVQPPTDAASAQIY